MEQNEFKYVLSDLYKIYMGAGLTYKEILNHIDANARFKSISRQYLMKEVEPDTSLESHLYYLQSDDPAAEIYETLGASVRLTHIIHKKTLFGKDEMIHKEEVWKVRKLFAMSSDEKQKAGMKISELQIPKIKLLEFIR